jgi:hypothetical protein
MALEISQLMCRKAWHKRASLIVYNAPKFCSYVLEAVGAECQHEASYA